MTNRALVMSGGGSKGAFEVGAVDYLVNDLGLEFQVIAGVSTGSLNAVMLAQGSDLAGLREELKTLKGLWFGLRSHKDIYKKRFMSKVFVFLFKDSLYNSKPIAEKIRTYISPQRLQNSGKELRIGAVVLETGDYHEIKQDDGNIHDWTLASSSMPLMFPPVKIGQHNAVDGGVRNVTPLEAAFKALKGLGPGEASTPDEMYVLLASPLGMEPEIREWKKGLDVAKRATSILVNEIYREDMDYALAINASVRACRKLQGKFGEEQVDKVLSDEGFPFKPDKFREVRILTIVPDREFSESLEFDKEKIRTAFSAGREAAKNPLDEKSLRDHLERTKPRRP